MRRDSDPSVRAAQHRAAVGENLDRRVSGLAVGVHQVELDVRDRFLPGGDKPEIGARARALRSRQPSGRGLLGLEPLRHGPAGLDHHATSRRAGRHGGPARRVGPGGRTTCQNGSQRDTHQRQLAWLGENAQGARRRRRADRGKAGNLGLAAARRGRGQRDSRCGGTARAWRRAGPDRGGYGGPGRGRRPRARQRRRMADAGQTELRRHRRHDQQREQVPVREDVPHQASPPESCSGIGQRAPGASSSSGARRP